MLWCFKAIKRARLGLIFLGFLALVVSVESARASPLRFPEVAPLPGEATHLNDIEATYRAAWAGCERRAEELLGVSHAPRVVSLAIEHGRDLSSPQLFAVTSGYGRQIEIRVFLSAQLPGLQHAGTTLCHEMIHALMRRHVSGYRNLAPWVREGSATYFSGEWKSRYADHLIRNIKAPGGPEGQVSEIDPDQRREHGFGLGEYFESATFFAYLDSLEAGLARRWLRLLVGGRNPEEATENLLRRGLRTVLEESRRWVQNELVSEQAAWPTGLRELALQKKNGARLFPAAAGEVFRSALGELEQQEPSSLRTLRLSWARFFYLRLVGGSRIYLSETEQLLASLLKQDQEKVWEVSEMGIPVSELLYARAYLRRDQGRLQDSLDDFLRIRRYHWEQPHLRGASVVGIGKVYFDLAQYEEAFRWLNPQPDANLRIEPDTCWYLVRAAIEVGATDRARQVFRIFSHQFSSSSAWSEKIEELRKRLEGVSLARLAI